MRGDIKFSGEIRSLKLRPGDTVVLTSPGYLSHETVEAISAVLKKKFPDHEVLVMGDGLKLEVVKNET